jgi:hypothetical protein
LPSPDEYAIPVSLKASVCHDPHETDIIFAFRLIGKGLRVPSQGGDAPILFRELTPQPKTYPSLVSAMKEFVNE